MMWRITYNEYDFEPAEITVSAETEEEAYQKFIDYSNRTYGEVKDVLYINKEDQHDWF